MKKFNLRICILLCIFSLTIIPVLLINVFYVFTVVQNVKKQSQVFYSDLVNQFAVNIDFYYSQYAEEFGNISILPSFQEILNRPKDLSAVNEKVFLYYSDTSTEFRQSVDAKKFGDFFIVEFDRKNPTNNMPYNLIDFSENLAVNIDVDKMVTEPSFKLMNAESEGKPILCESGILKKSSSEEYSDRTFFFYPYKKNSKNELKYLMGVMCNEDFFYNNIYKNNSGIERGTLYLHDQFGELLNVNHPSENDYYKYDHLVGKYQYGDTVHENTKSQKRMTLKEYQLLNTDQEILQAPQFLHQREVFDNEGWSSPNCSVVLHKQQKFLSIFMRAPLSQIEISFFYPLVLVYMPVVGIVIGNLILMALLLIVVSLIIIKVTDRLMLPITQLISVQKEVEHGNYDVKLNEEMFYGEFADIGKNFNAIVSKNVKERADANMFLEEQQTQILSNSKNLEAAAKKVKDKHSMMEVNLLEILPKKEVEKILSDEKIEPVVYENISLLFFEIKELFGVISSATSSEQLAELNNIFIQFDEIMNKYGCYKIRTQGQTYLAACGFPLEDSWNVQHITAAATECVKLIEKRNAGNEKQIKFRAGIYFGSITVGVIGTKKYTYDILGNTVTDAYNFLEQMPLGKLSASSDIYQALQNNKFWKFERFKEVILKNGKIEEMFLFCGEK